MTRSVSPSLTDLLEKKPAALSGEISEWLSSRSGPQRILPWIGVQASGGAAQPPVKVGLVLEVSIF